MKIWIEKNIIENIFSNGVLWLPKETGGILMGYFLLDQYVITDFIGPGEKAIHKINSFKPDQEFHEREITRIYKESEQKITYLGDWHTHPNSFPYLSETDKRTFKKIADYSKARLSNPIMLVVAPPTENFKVWIYKKNTKREILYEEGNIIIF